MGKMEDNLTYTTNGSGVDLESLVSVSCVDNPTPSFRVTLPNNAHIRLSMMWGEGDETSPDVL